jgi:hypothetical protein
MGRITSTISRALNVFTNDPEVYRGPSTYSTAGGSFGGSRPYASRGRINNERSIIGSIYATMAVDVSDIELRHALTDEEGNYVSTEKSELQFCLSQEANLDQAARHFRRDVALTMFDKGVAAIIPVDYHGNKATDPLEILSKWDVVTMRVGEVVDWYPRSVKVRVYNDQDDKGIFEDITLPKSMVALVENPFYNIMNEPNSTLQRLMRKLSLLDVTDEKASSGKLDLLIQLPYTIKTDVRRAEAEQRRKDIEFQLAGGQYGIAYTDGTEKVTQLNRPIENNLWEQITDLTNMLYSELGITAEIMNGTADEATMTNYMSRRIEPIVDAVAEEIHRKFLSKKMLMAGHKIMYFRDPFKLIPITRLAEIADVLSRNEIATPNDVRKAVGWIPSKDPKASQLNNSNMPEPKSPDAVPEDAGRFVSKQMQVDDEEAELDKTMSELGIS